MSGRRTSVDGNGDSPAPASSRRTRSRGGASPAASGSPSIAPLSEGGVGGQQQEPSPSVGQPRLPAISEASPSQQQQPQPQAGSSPSPSPSLPPRSPSADLLRGVRSFGSGRDSQRMGTTPGARGAAYRPDLGPTPVRPMITVSEVDIPEIDAPGGSGPAPSSAGGPTTVIWGTNINAETLRQKVDQFLWNYKEQGSALDKYTELIKKAAENQGVLNLDTSDLRAADPQLYKWLLAYPHEVLPIFDHQAQSIAGQMLSMNESDEPPMIICRPFKLGSVKTIRELNPADIDQLICVEGMVTRTSGVIPDLRVAHFSCAKCGHEAKVNNEGGKVEEPASCARCKAKSVHSLIHNLSLFSNKQLIKMQEKPNDIPEGETPHAVVLHAFEANVDVCRPGDRVSITGILRALPMRVNPRQRTLHALFKTYIDVLHIDRIESSRLFAQSADREKADRKKAAETQDAETGSATDAAAAAGSQANPPSQSGVTGVTSQDAPVEEDRMDVAGGAHDTLADQYVDLGNETEAQVKAKEERIRELAADPNIYQRLVDSFAPNVWEMDDVKKGLLCQLFGGMCKSFPGGRIRGELNVLMVGDPSVSKSQLLSYVHSLAPRGIYTSGQGSSAVGLTAYVTKDPETREMVLESGALVLSDRGVCCIDEFDKMSESARSVLHEAMEQQTVSIAKAGLISTLNARTSVCACANPIGSRYNPHLTLGENINLPATLLSRFDLIYRILDTCDEERDRKLARHLVSLFYEHVPERKRHETMIPQDLLQEYIAYARTRINPKLSDEAIEQLVIAYSNLRDNGRQKKVVVATPRQLESLIRLSEAMARMRLSESVTRWDVDQSVSLWYSAMQGSAGSADGTLDMDNIFTGASTEARVAAKMLPGELRTILQSVPGATSVGVDELYQRLQQALSSSGKPFMTREQMVVSLRQMDDVTLDERTGVVRSRGARA